MDLSKLPKFSQTQQEQGAAPPPASEQTTPRSDFCRACGSPLRAGAKFCDACGAPTATRAATGSSGARAETWISIAIGVILLFLFPHLILYLVHPGTTAFDATDNQTGATIPYAHSAFIWPDVGVTFFCLLLIVEPLLILIAPKRATALLGLVLSLLCAVFNLFVVARSMNVLGFQVGCAVAIAFSIYIAIQRWGRYRSM